MNDQFLSMKNITKVYPNGIVANSGVDFSINKGEIHALVGENGAGKSTLMKILFGMETAQEGEILVKGKSVKITSSNVAIQNGIGMVHQHFMLVPSLTVAENILLGIEPKRGIFVDKEQALTITKNLAEKYNFNIDPNAKVEGLSVGIKQKVEILKALIRGAEILILDEPTAVLTPQETEELFKQLILLKENGHSIIFISHKLQEIKSICDRLTIMRSGKSMGVYATKDVTKEEISKLMVGRDVILKMQKSKSNPKEPVLKVSNLSYLNDDGKKILNKISLYVRRGEVLGIAGVEGNGQGELVEIITGLRKGYSGKVQILGEDISPLTIKSIRNLGISHIPEDRMTYGVAQDVDIEQNLISDKYDSKELNGKFLLKRSRIRELTDRLIEEYKVKCNSPNQNVKMLSGGNIQKVVVAREFSSNPELLVANQPTRGIDVGASEFIRKKIIELRDQEKAVLLISADLNEVLELSDSLAVMYNGEIVAHFNDSEKVTEEELGLFMLGLKKQSNDELRRATNE
ncbi:ABC transporter ATP-binding protein [Neobacillus sp. NPDC093127]|uniref:ABC transporter ATP-binding protein n=1 Tax=Neobacillus sp. NPDC093127 TaxID=3364296 RepID=UPI0037F3BCD9